MSNETTNTLDQIDEIFSIKKEEKYDFPWNIVRFYQEKSDLKGDYLCKISPKVRVASLMLDLHIKNYESNMSEYQLSSLKKIQEDLKVCSDLFQQYWEDLPKVGMPDIK